jgi:hypothetical protein
MLLLRDYAQMDRGAEHEGLTHKLFSPILVRCRKSHCELER